VKKFSWARRAVESAVRFEPVRWLLFKYCDKRYMHLIPVHPFDNQYGIGTSGFLPGAVLRLADPDKKNTAYLGYIGVQPSIIRRTLKMLPQHNKTTFLDLGCGKGRALVVASEFPFRSVIGVEISPELARSAKKNAQAVSRNHPDRTPITVVKANALDYSLPEGNLIIFLYNPFGEYLIKSLLAQIESAASKGDNNIWVIYINPVWGHIFDGSPTLSRIYAESIPYESEEIGFGSDSSDVVIVWQDAKSVPTTSPGVNRGIVVTDLGRRAELVD
jgi:SAM-dependent methyltransferase